MARIYIDDVAEPNTLTLENVPETIFAKIMAYAEHLGVELAAEEQ